MIRAAPARIAVRKRVPAEDDCDRGSSVVDGAVSDGADHGRVAVVEEQRGAGVHGGDTGHVVVGKREVENVEFCAIRSGRTDLGTATMLRWVSQRSTT